MDIARKRIPLNARQQLPAVGACRIIADRNMWSGER